MQITNGPISRQKTAENNISLKGGRSFVRTLANADALTSTILLEGAVTSGRGFQAYKRGGFPEFRERFTDDVVSALFWMKGVDIFNNLGNKFGEKVLKLPTTEFDVGKDALRTPFNNVIQELRETIQDEKTVKSLEKKLAAFKFTKILLSTILATAFVGFCLPKINQAITKGMMRAKRRASNKNAEQKQTFNDELIKQNSFEAFDRKISKNSTTAFKGSMSSVMTTVAHYLENNKICKLLTCDVGILTGRFKTARNVDEGKEYLLRDSLSSFFYYASTPLIYGLLQKLTGTKKQTNIDPVAAKQLYENMLANIRNTDGGYISMNAKDFAKKTLGVLDDGAQSLISSLEFNSDVISLENVINHLTDENLISKAKEMAKLQPPQAGIGRVLTRQQVQDVLKDGSVTSAKFMQEIFGEKFGKALTDKSRYIPMKKITSFRDNIENFVQAVVDKAIKTNNGIVDKKLLDKINKQSFMMSSMFRAAAMICSALALGIAIPKLQYAMTARRTGSNAAPGLREYQTVENKKTEN